MELILPEHPRLVRRPPADYVRLAFDKMKQKQTLEQQIGIRKSIDVGGSITAWNLRRHSLTNDPASIYVETRESMPSGDITTFIEPLSEYL